MVHDQYWKELFQLKTHIGVIERLLERAEKVDRSIRIFLAITSSSSIAAWVVWSQLSWLWASIIAVSQVISAINAYLPYQNTIKSYSALLNELEELMIQAEFKWHSIAEGKLTEEEINKARFDIRTTKHKSLKKHVATTIPTTDKIHAQAEQSARVYLENFYPS